MPKSVIKKHNTVHTLQNEMYMMCVYIEAVSKGFTFFLCSFMLTSTLESDLYRKEE